jgi:citrate lyase beta subunit
VNDELRAAISAGEERRAALIARGSGGRPTLPLRWWRQQAHLTVPGSDAGMIRKALERGTAPMARLMAAVGVSPRDVADRLDIGVDSVERLLDRPRSAPVVMVDLEDATADGAGVRTASVGNAAEAFGLELSAGAPGQPLRFLRPPGLDTPASVDELLQVLWAAARPPDAVVLPKVGDAEEVGLLIDLLADAEQARGVEPGSIRVALLVESAAAVLHLAQIAERVGPRLCGLVFGLADFAADLALPEVDPLHPAAMWARTQIVAVAGWRDVPAIDAMTFAYPVADAAAPAATNRRSFLDSLAAVHADARSAHAMGMSGKLVGHPAQLFATLLAFESALPNAKIEAAASSVEQYAAAREQGQGATMIDGRMADVATDLHARRLLRIATANGRFAADRAFRLGIVDAMERAELDADNGVPRT